MKVLVAAVVAALVSTAGCAREPGKLAQAPGAPVRPPEALRLRIVPNGFQLDWKLSPQDPGAVTGYELVRSDRFTGPYDTVATVGKGKTRHVDATASREIIYFYKVRAVAGTRSSPFSNTVAGER
jgi:hypothetical protein